VEAAANVINQVADPTSRAFNFKFDAKNPYKGVKVQMPSSSNIFPLTTIKEKMSLNQSAWNNAKNSVKMQRTLESSMAPH
jgi:hypothetical protein